MNLLSGTNHNSLTISNIVQRAAEYELIYNRPFCPQVLRHVFTPGSRQHMVRRTLGGGRYDKAKLFNLQESPNLLCHLERLEKKRGGWPEGCVSHLGVHAEVADVEGEIAAMLLLQEVWGVHATPEVDWVWRNKPNYKMHWNDDANFGFLQGDVYLDICAIATPHHAAAYFQTVFTLLDMLYRTAPHHLRLMQSAMHNLAVCIALYIDWVCKACESEQPLDFNLCTACYRCYAAMLSFQQHQLIPYMEAHPSTIEDIYGEHLLRHYKRQCVKVQNPLTLQVRALLYSDPAFTLLPNIELYDAHVDMRDTRAKVIHLLAYNCCTLPPTHADLEYFLREMLLGIVEAACTDRRVKECYGACDKGLEAEFCKGKFKLLTGDAVQDHHYFQSPTHGLVYLSAMLKYIYLLQQESELTYENEDLFTRQNIMVTYFTMVETVESLLRDKRAFGPLTLCLLMQQCAHLYQRVFFTRHITLLLKLQTLSEEAVRDYITLHTNTVSLWPYHMRENCVLLDAPWKTIPALALKHPSVAFVSLYLTLHEKRNFSPHTYIDDALDCARDPDWDLMDCGSTQHLYLKYCEKTGKKTHGMPKNIRRCYDALEKLFSLTPSHCALVTNIVDTRPPRRVPISEMVARRVTVNPETAQQVEQRSLTLEDLPVRAPGSPFFPLPVHFSLTVDKPMTARSQMREIFPLAVSNVPCADYSVIIARDNVLMFNTHNLLNQYQANYMHKLRECFVQAFLPCSSDATFEKVSYSVQSAEATLHYQALPTVPGEEQSSVPEDAEYLWRLLPCPLMPRKHTLTGSAHHDSQCYASWHHAYSYVRNLLVEDEIVFHGKADTYLEELRKVRDYFIAQINKGGPVTKVNLKTARHIYLILVRLSHIKPAHRPMRANVVKLCPRVYLNNIVHYNSRNSKFLNEALSMHFLKYYQQCQQITRLDFAALLQMLDLEYGEVERPPPDFCPLQAFIKMSLYMGDFHAATNYYPEECRALTSCSHPTELLTPTPLVAHLSTREDAVQCAFGFRLSYFPKPRSFDILKYIIPS
ncbi:ORF42 [Ranid herpesvirus 2]|uniref:ORF42 n=1 Tax=Ranid herpesvirus 2 TaxID=389214 RepID=Q14W64_9VIRU|nr:ORF42 [Ranid herpesvirus 2]ABG25583.1 ORF42 [Ranid herpesvirus 2]